MGHTEIVITGMGATTPLGGTVSELWDAILSLRSGIRSLEGAGIPGFDDTLPVRIAGVLAVEPEAALTPAHARRLDRSQQAAVVAAREAWQDAGAPEVDGDRLAVVIGTGIGGVQTLLAQDDVLERSGARRVSPRTVPMLMANAAAAQLSIEYGARAAASAPSKTTGFPAFKAKATSDAVPESSIPHAATTSADRTIMLFLASPTSVTIATSTAGETSVSRGVSIPTLRRFTSFAPAFAA